MTVRKNQQRWSPIGVLVGCVAVMMLVAGCSNQPSAKNISIDGSSTVYPVTEAVAEEFTKESPQIRVVAGFSGTGGGFKKFISGDIAICGASRGIKDSEQEQCEAGEIGYIQLEVAFDGLAVVLNPNNDWCDSMTVDQLKELWRPESAVQKWSDLNPEWPGEEIKLYGPGTDSGTFDYFTEAIVGEGGASRADYTASEDDNMLVTGVQEDPYALGYFGFAYYAENKDKLKLMGVDNGTGPVTPSEATVRDGSYAPLSRPLYIYVRNSALERPEVEKFVRFYLDKSGEMASEVGYVPISDEAAAKNEDAFRGATGGQG
jgi:phosphate transport system substrate-binding protein